MKSPTSWVTWVLASVAALLLVAVAVVVTFIIGDRATFTDDNTTGSTESVATETSTVTPRPSPSTTTPTVTEQQAPPTTTTQYVAPEPASSAPALGGQCLESELRTFATAPDGQGIVCNYMGADGGFVWVGHAENDGSVHNIGDPCDSSVDRVAQDPSGKAIMCGGTEWVGGP